MSFEPVDIAVLMLSSSLALILLVSTYSISLKGTDISPTREKILTALVAGVLSAVSMYIGARLEQDPCCALLEGKGEVKILEQERASERRVEKAINQISDRVTEQLRAEPPQPGIRERLDRALEGQREIQERLGAGEGD